MNFGEALAALKSGKVVSRTGWNNAGIFVLLQNPDENSKMTEPYLYMVKRNSTEGTEKRFPLDLSCESVLADDWQLVDL